MRAVGPRSCQEKWAQGTNHRHRRLLRPCRSGHTTAAPPRSVMNLRASFDHLVGAGEQREGDGDAERLGGFQVDDQLYPGRLLDGRSAGLSPLRIRPV